MSNRTIRVNELILRELGDILRQHYREEAVTITVTEVRVTPDLREGRIFVSVIGDAEEATKKMRWIRKQSRAIRMELGKRIVLKYLPHMEYVFDDSAERGTRIVKLLEEVDQQSKKD